MYIILFEKVTKYLFNYVSVYLGIPTDKHYIIKGVWNVFFKILSKSKHKYKYKYIAFMSKESIYI